MTPGRNSPNVYHSYRENQIKRIPSFHGLGLSCALFFRWSYLGLVRSFCDHAYDCCIGKLVSFGRKLEPISHHPASAVVVRQSVEKRADLAFLAGRSAGLPSIIRRFIPASVGDQEDRWLVRATIARFAWISSQQRRTYLNHISVFDRARNHHQLTWRASSIIERCDQNVGFGAGANRSGSLAGSCWAAAIMVGAWRRRPLGMRHLMAIQSHSGSDHTHGIIARHCLSIFSSLIRFPIPHFHQFFLNELDIWRYSHTQALITLTE